MLLKYGIVKKKSMLWQESSLYLKKKPLGANRNGFVLYVAKR
jgi:hypothetical protein